MRSVYSADESTPALRLVDVSVKYDEVSAVADVSLAVADAEMLGVLGPNGAGKSSLARAIVGTVKASRGRIEVDGRSVAGLRPHQRTSLGLALSPEGRGVLGPLTVMDNLLLGTYACGRLQRSDVADRLTDVFELFPILDVRSKQLAATLSGGEAAMLSIGRALMAKPRVLILDEPSLGLAPMLTDAVFERLRTLRDRGQAILVVEQRADLVDSADRLLVMRRGSVVAEVSTSDASDDNLRDLYFGNLESLSTTAGNGRPIEETD